MLSENMTGARELWEKLWHGEQKPQTLAALVLCESVTGTVSHKPDNNRDEIAASRAFIEWYRKLFAMRAQKTLARVMERMSVLNDALPSAAKLLGAAMAEAKVETAAA